ncbi:hypothetical protein EBX93_12060, partial [bacterium]|nr:hypothetical protein [bacterium]
SRISKEELPNPWINSDIADCVTWLETDQLATNKKPAKTKNLITMAQLPSTNILQIFMIS